MKVLSKTLSFQKPQKQILITKKEKIENSFGKIWQNLKIKIFKTEK